MPRSEPPRGPVRRLPESRRPQRLDCHANQSPAGRGLSQSSWTFLLVSSARCEFNIVQERRSGLSSRPNSSRGFPLLVAGGSDKTCWDFYYDSKTANRLRERTV